jgi:hypothetical protein
LPPDRIQERRNRRLALPPRCSRGRREETLARLPLVPLPPLHLLAAAGRRRQPKAGRGRRRGPSFPLALGARRGPISQSRDGVLTGARRRGGSGDGVATCGGGASSWRQRWSSGGCCNFGRRGRRLRAGDLDRTVADAGMVRPPALAVAGSEAVQLPTVTGGAGQRRRGLGQDLGPFGPDLGRRALLSYWFQGFRWNPSPGHLRLGC